MDYYASNISEHLGETPEGFIVAPGVCLGRTGFQKYAVSELPVKAAHDLGIDTSNQSALVDVYRSPEEVFDSAAIASLEGKPVTLNHPPAAEFVDPSNFADYAYGHVQHVRKGNAPLDAGDWPLLGDIFITREPLIGRVKSGELRELSIGYDYALSKDGERICQTAIRGNHVAIVPRGRAGAEARINDSAPVVPERNEAGQGSTGKQKEKPKVQNLLKHILGLGLKAYAADADPEKLAEAAEAVKEEKEKQEAPLKPAQDTEPKPAEPKDPKDPKDPKPAAEDAHADDRRAKLHSALDRMLDKITPVEAKPAEDVDIEELRDLLDQFFQEEEGEEEHQEGEGEGGGGEPQPATEDVDFITSKNGYECPIRGTKGYSRSKAGEGRRRARDQFIQPLDEPTAKNSVADALEVLNALRPVIARSNDANLRRAFNAQLGRFTRSSRSSSASYAGAAEASRTRAADAGDPEKQKHSKLQAAYDQARTGKKEDK